MVSVERNITTGTKGDKLELLCGDSPDKSTGFESLGALEGSETLMTLMLKEQGKAHKRIAEIGKTVPVKLIKEAEHYVTRL